MLLYLGIGLINIVLLPLLPFVPRHWESQLEQFSRDQQEEKRSSLFLVWLLPSGRFALWFAATLVLAQFVTVVPPSPAHFALWDVGLLAFLVGILKAEFGEAASDMATYGGLRRYLTDAFNVLDMGLILLLGLLLITRRAHVADADSFLADMELPTQALLALVAWLRLAQILFMFSKSGPLLLMAIRMLEDLWQFLMLASIVVVAFACAFYVLLSHERITVLANRRHHALAEQSSSAPAARAGTGAGTDAPGGVAEEAALLNVYTEDTPVNLWHVLGLLVESFMKGEPDHIMVQSEESSLYAWCVMFLFGIVVVLLLLNLLIARFAKTFDMVQENVDANFKVAFARIVIEGRKKELLPPPFNLASAFIAMLYDFVQGKGWLFETLRDLTLACGRWILRVCEVVLDCTVDPELRAKQLATRRLVDEEEGRSRAAEDDEEGGSSGGGVGRSADETDSSDEAHSGWVAQHVHGYLRKAVEERPGSRGTLVEQVVHFVCNRRFDIAREEQWRTELTRQMGHMELSLNKLDTKADAIHSATPSAQVLSAQIAEALSAQMAVKVEETVGALLRNHSFYTPLPPLPHGVAEPTAGTRMDSIRRAARQHAPAVAAPAVSAPVHAPTADTLPPTAEPPAFAEAQPPTEELLQCV